MKILFITNYPSPYRVEFFNQLGQQKNIELTVLFIQNPKEISWRSSDWFDENYANFHAVFLQNKLHLGKKIVIFKDVFLYLKKRYDFIIFGGYSYPTFMIAMEYLKRKNIPYGIEIDGGLIKQDTRLQFQIKKHFLSSAAFYLCPGEAAEKYLVHYGAKVNLIYYYPFTSFAQRDLDNALGKNIQDCSFQKWKKQRETLRRKNKQKNNIKCKRMALFVGQFVPRKGADLLLRVADKFKNSLDFYFVGGKITEEYKAIIQEKKLNNVFFEGFKKKEELAGYYRAADLFVMPTRHDIWGLVIEEAMAYGLPIISTNRCVAAMDLVKDGENGYICQADDEKSLLVTMEKIVSDDWDAMGYSSYQKVQSYTIENMVKAHMKFFKENKEKNETYDNSFSCTICD